MTFLCENESKQKKEDNNFNVVRPWKLTSTESLLFFKVMLKLQIIPQIWVPKKKKNKTKKKKPKQTNKQGQIQDKLICDC